MAQLISEVNEWSPISLKEKREVRGSLCMVSYMTSNLRVSIKIWRALTMSDRFVYSCYRIFSLQ